MMMHEKLKFKRRPKTYQRNYINEKLHNADKFKDEELYFNCLSDCLDAILLYLSDYRADEWNKYKMIGSLIYMKVNNINDYEVGLNEFKIALEWNNV